MSDEDYMASLAGYPVPEVDDLMPPLDRKGKRGPLNKEERAYVARREHLDEVLTRYRETQEALAETQTALDVVRKQFGEEACAAMSTALVTLIRLTGGEPTKLRYSADETGLYLILEIKGVKYVIQRFSDNYSISVYPPKQGRQNFDLNASGQLSTKEFLALRSYLDVQRPAEESYPRDVLADVFPNGVFGLEVPVEPS